MMKPVRHYYLLGLLLFVSACATQSRNRGVVAMAIDDRVAHVCVGRNEVGSGQAITVVRNECSNTAVWAGKSGAGRRAVCRTVRLGTGRITRVLNDHYSEVRFDKPIQVKRGDEIVLTEFQDQQKD